MWLTATMNHVPRFQAVLCTLTDFHSSDPKGELPAADATGAVTYPPQESPQPHHPSTRGTSATALQHPVPWEPLLLDHAAGSDPAGKMSHEFSLADALPKPTLPKPPL